MLIEPLLKLLQKLKLTGMLAALERQLTDPDIDALRFEERFAMLLQHETRRAGKSPLRPASAHRSASATRVS